MFFILRSQVSKIPFFTDSNSLNSSSKKEKNSKRKMHEMHNLKSSAKTHAVLQERITKNFRLFCRVK